MQRNSLATVRGVPVPMPEASNQDFVGAPVQLKVRWLMVNQFDTSSRPKTMLHRTMRVSNTSMGFSIVAVRARQWVIYKYPT